ncbi:MAG: apolipoprotein N-acyltransferase [candidate division NC10 bacterium]|nr:apolipoprotein N-acyltransferase [candidate division NC10 bacterium]
MSGVPSPGLRLGLALASGLAAAAAFPPWDAGWLAFVALVPFLVALEGTSPRQALALGFWQGFSFYLVTVWWVINTMTTYGRMAPPLAVLALLLLCAVLAGYHAAFAWLLSIGRAWFGCPAWLVPGLAAGLWTALEMLRTILFSGFPWALFGYSQYRHETIRLLASLVGVYGISALLVWLNAAVAEGIRALRCPQPGAHRGRVVLAILTPAAALFAGSLGYGAAFWRDAATGPALTVALLQGNIDQSLKWERSYQGETLAVYEELARRVARARPALVVWPETAVPFFLRYEKELGGRVVRFVAATGIPMLLGSPDVGPDRRLYNAAFLLDGSGTIRGRYDKRHLVPFGEYVPLQPLFFFLDKLVVGIGDFGRGEEATLLPLGAARFGTMICYEVIFPAEVREFVRRGAQFLVNITNDAWFGKSGAPYQHLAMAAMRAVENGTYLVRAANTGVTAVVTPSGEIRQATSLFTRAAVVATIRLREGETPYARYGDVLPWACVVGLGGYLLLFALRRKKQT